MYTVFIPTGDIYIFIFIYHVNMSLNMQTGPLESDIGTEMIFPDQNKLHQKPCFFTTMYYIYRGVS